MQQNSNNPSAIHLVFDVCFTNKFKEVFDSFQKIRADMRKSKKYTPDQAKKVKELFALYASIQKIKEAYFTANEENPLTMPTPFLGEFLYKNKNLTNLFHFLNQIDSKKYTPDQAEKLNDDLSEIEKNIPPIEYTYWASNAGIKTKITSPRVQTTLLNEEFTLKADKKTSAQWTDFRNQVKKLAKELFTTLSGTGFPALTEENVHAAEIEHKVKETGRKDYQACNKIDYQTRTTLHNLVQNGNFVPVIFSNDQQNVKRSEGFFPVYALPHAWRGIETDQTTKILNAQDLPQHLSFLTLSAQNTGGKLIPCVNVSTSISTPGSKHYAEKQADDYIDALSSKIDERIKKGYIPAPVLLAFRKNEWDQVSPIYKANKKDAILDFGVKEAIAFSILMRKLLNNNAFSESGLAEKKYYVQILAIMIMNPEKPIIAPDGTEKKLKEITRDLFKERANAEQALALKHAKEAEKHALIRALKRNKEKDN